MILHPMILLPKLIVIILLVVMLVWLHGVLTSGQWLMALFASIVFLLLFAIFLLWLFGRLTSKSGSRLGKGFVLQGRSDSSKGFVAANFEKKLLIGKRGTTLSMLRPAGKAAIEGARIDVVSDGEFIPKDREVEVVKVEGNRVIVKEVA